MKFNLPLLRAISCATLLSLSLPASGQESSAEDTASAAKEAAEIGDADEYSGKTPRSMEQAMAVLTRRHRNAPTAGTKAPAFELEELGSGKKVSLASLHSEKPVVLLFASYQCDVFARGWPSFLNVYKSYKDRLNFVMIYIREAHATDGIRYGNPKFADPKSNEQRAQMASLCQRQMKVPFPILIDQIEDPVATRWGAWPIRMVVVKRDGTVGYTSINGPFGFRPDATFLHGDGQAATNGADRGYNQETLDSYLQTLLGSTDQ